MQQEQLKNSEPARWFVTGSTGFIGRELIRALLPCMGTEDRLTVLVRAGQTLSARERFVAALADIVPEAQLSRIEVVRGNISDENFGLASHDWEQVSRSTHLVHLAANTSFTASLAQARDSNVIGARNMLSLANACQRNGCLRHWSHTSTAYVAGNRTDIVQPGEHNHGCRFRNYYEQSKREAEQLLQPCLANFPLTIFRPSIVIGNSKTGEAGNFNTVYWAIRSYLSGQTKLYARADAPLDIVPVDFIAQAMLALIAHPDAIGKTLHLAAGEKHTVPLVGLTDQVCRYLDSPPPDILNPNRLKLLRGVLALARLSPKHRRFIAQAESYLPYFSSNPIFDTTMTEHLLRESGIQVPQLQSYLPRILDYCLTQPWGKRSKMVGAGYHRRKVANG